VSFSELDLQFFILTDRKETLTWVKNIKYCRELSAPNFHGQFAGLLISKGKMVLYLKDYFSRLVKSFQGQKLFLVRHAWRVTWR